MDIQNIVSSINWNAPSWDLFIVIIFLGGMFLYSLRLSRDKVFVILLSSYISLAFVGKYALLVETFGIKLNSNSFIVNSAIFLGGMLLLFFIISNSIFVSIFDQGARRLWLQSIVIGFFQLGLVVSVIVSFLPPDEIKNLSIFVKTFFGNNQAQSFWLLSPFAAMIFFRGK